MKILIMSVTAGEGHNSTAKAMQSYFLSHGAECDILDTYGYVSPGIANSLNKGYLWVSSRAKSAYKLGYRLAEKRKPLRAMDLTEAQIVHMHFSHEIHEYIHMSQPDVILFTHPFAGLILNTLKQENKIAIPTVGILTDFIFHPYWEDCTANDYVVTPSPALRFQAYKKGFTDRQILSFGIPIHPKFSVSVPQEDARRKLNLNPKLKTVLLMGGSMGYGKMADSLRALDEIPLQDDFQIICVCGNNKKAKEEIDGIETRHHVLNLGFVDYVDLLMDASDCIVTKPGGLTTSEALAKRLPMIIVNPIPGQEARNAEFLLNSGAAMSTNKIWSAEELVYWLFSEPQRLDAIRMCIDEVRRPNSTRDVCEFAIRLAKERIPEKMEAIPHV